MFQRPIRLALQSVSRAIRRQVTNDPASTTKNRLDETFNNLDLHVRRTGRVTKREIVDIFNQVKQKPSASPTHTLLLLRCCGSILIEEPSQKRNELAEEVWTTLKNKVAKIDISHYNALLKVYLENEKDFNPLQFLKEIEENGLEPNRVTYQRLIHRYCFKGDIEGATKILEFMKSKDLPINESVFNSLIVGYMKVGDIDAAIANLDVMKKSSIDPSNVTYTVLLSCLAEKAQSDPKAAESFKKSFEEACSTVFLTDKMKLDILKSLFLNDAPSSITESVEKTLEKKISFKQDAINVCTELINVKRLDQAYRLFKLIPIDGHLGKYKSFGMSFIYQMVKVGYPPEDVLKVCRQLKDDDINLYGLSKAVDAAIDLVSDKNTFRTYLKAFLREKNEPNPRIHFFFPLLIRCKTQEEVMQVIREDMENVQYTASGMELVEAFTDFIWPKMDDYQVIFQECRALGYSIPILTTSLVSHLLEKNDFSSAHRILTDPALKAGRLLSAPVVVPLANSVLKTGVSSYAADILVTFLRQDVNTSPSQRTFDFLFHIAQNMDRNEAEPSLKKSLPSLLVDLRRVGLFILPEHAERLKTFGSMSNVKTLLNKLASEGSTVETEELERTQLPSSIEELEDHLIELKSKNMNSRGCIRKLLLEYCRRAGAQLYQAIEGQIDSDSEDADEIHLQKQPALINRIHELIREMELDGGYMGDGLRAAILEFYFNIGDFHRGKQILAELSPTFVLDDFKVMNVCRALIRAGHLDEALTFLREEASRPERVGRKETIKTREQDRGGLTFIFRLLNTAAECTKDPAFLDEVFNLCMQFRDIKRPANSLLGPRVKVHILRNDVDAAVDEFANCVTSYKQTPWFGEILRLLILKGDSAKLQMVTDMANSIHGEENVLGDLAVAFVKVGKIKQAASVFSTIGFRLRPSKVSYFAERFARRKEVHHLETLLAATKDIQSVNREEVYYNLIRGYRAINDPDKALGVWTSMQEEEIIPTPRTLAFLGNFLKSCGHKVPFEIPELEETSGAEDVVAKRTPSDIRSYIDTLRLDDVQEALKARGDLLTFGTKPSLANENFLLDKLLANNLLNEAFDITMQLIKSGQFPNPRNLRNLWNKLGGEGNVAKMEELRPKLPAEFTNAGTFTNPLARAYLIAKREDELMDVLKTLKPLPLFAIKGILEQRPDLEPKVIELVELMEKDNYTLPKNMVWGFYMVKKRFGDAERVLKETSKLRTHLLFSAVMDSIREQQDIQLADELIRQCSMTSLTPRSLGVVYSAKLDVLVDQEQHEEAEKVLIDLINTPKPRIHEETGETIPPLQITDLNRTALIRLYNKISEKCGREPRFTVPEKTIQQEESHEQTPNHEDLVKNTVVST